VTPQPYGLCRMSASRSASSTTYIVNILHDRGYDGIKCVLPHDGVSTNSITGKRYSDHLEDAGFYT